MELIALEPRGRLFPYELRNKDTLGYIDTLVIQHGYGEQLDAQAPRGWTVHATTPDQATFNATKGYSLAPGGELPGFGLVANRANRLVDGSYALTLVGGAGYRSGTIKVPAK